MDILKWLEETEQHHVPQDACKRKRLPRRAKSDSSLLEPLPFQDSPVQQRPRKQAASDVLVASSSSSSTSNRYARKPRRKTRPDRYGPNKPEHSGPNNSSKKARHKSRQKKAEKSGQLVRNFKANNVSGDRLTLKPSELGLFNKGRASAAVRGRGLPDLVFSEMKFLQKHDESKPPPQPDVSRKKRKIDHTKDEEISTFFTTGRHTLAQKVQDEPASHSSVREKQRRHHNHSSMTDVAIPTVVEPVDRVSFPNLNGQHPRHESTSCVSWSGSIRALSTTSAHHQADDDAPHDWHDSDRYGHCRSKPNRPQRTFKQPEPPSVAKQTTDDAPGCFRVSSLAPSHSRGYRLQSCPQQASSPKQVNLVDRSAKLQTTGTAYSSSSMPPAVPPYPNMHAYPGLAAKRSNSPRVGRPSDLRKEPRPVSKHRILDDDYNDGGEDQETSSDLEMVLQVCKDTFYNQHRSAPSPRSGANRSEQLLPMQSADRPHRTNSRMPTQRIPTVRFAELPAQHYVQPTFRGPSIYEQQAQHQYLPLGILGNEAVGDDPWAFEQEYMDNGMAMDYGDGDWDDPLEESMLHGLENHISEDSWPINRHVAPGFWRPNKLY